MGLLTNGLWRCVGDLDFQLARNIDGTFRNDDNVKNSTHLFILESFAKCLRQQVNKSDEGDEDDLPMRDMPCHDLALSTIRC